MSTKVVFHNILRPHLANPQVSENLEFNIKIHKLKESGEKIIHYGFGQSPFPVPTCLQNSLKEFSHINCYLSMAGLMSLRKQLVHYHRQWDGINIEADNILIGPGSKELLYLTLANFNGVVLFPTPAWPTYQRQCELAGCEFAKIDTNASENWKLTPEALKIACQKFKNTNKFLIFTNPGNPSGQCYTEKEIISLSKVCKDEGIIVASDEIYGRITHCKDHYCMAKYYPEGTLLYTGFSKWLSIGGWRMGYVHFPSTLKTLYQAVDSSASHTYTCAPTLIQYAIEKSLRENYDELEEYREKCSLVLKTVGEFCHRQLNSVGVKGSRSEAGYYYLPDFEVIREGLAKRGILTGKQMTDAMLKDIGVGLMSTGAFNRPDSELCVRFCFVCFDGKLTLDNLDKLTTAKYSEDEFVKTFCSELYEGIQMLKKWVIKHTI